MAYTTIDHPGAHFQAELYTGNGVDGTAQTFDAGVALQPDLMWIKRRNEAASHNITDSTRGVTKYIYTDAVTIEGTDDNRVLSLDSDGFTLGTNEHTNENNDTYSAYGWKANGGTTSSNTNGSVTSTVQANTTAGFSIATWTGTGATATIGHGLGAVPQMIIIKCRSAAHDWQVLHHTIATDYWTDYMVLNEGQAAADHAGKFNDTAPTSTVFTVGDNGSINPSSGTMVGYFFTPIQGFSKFGSWKGNGSASSGPFIYTGFKPAWVMAKHSNDGTDDWLVWDDKTMPTNHTGDTVSVNGHAVNVSNSTHRLIDFYSNGFKIWYNDSNLNANNKLYIYAAFAEAPFVTSEGIPATAR